MTLRAWLGLGGFAMIATLLAAIYWNGRNHGAEIERRKAVDAYAQAEIATIDAELARRAAARGEAVVRRQANGAELARQHSIEALRAEDANESLVAGRAARLRTVDRELCELAPSLEGCAPAG